MPTAKKTTKASRQHGAVAEMGLASTSVMELFLQELEAMYWTENQLLFSIPVLERASSASSLKAALADHLEITKEHVGRLEMIFEMMKEKICAVKCNAMEGLDMDAENILQNTMPESPERDMGIILAAQKVEQHEAAGYKGLIKLANLLNREDVVTILQQTLQEEMMANDLLDSISLEEYPTAI